MLYDIFFSISQTPAKGECPSEAEMFGNFFRQLEAADAQGYGVGWVAEAHLSSQVQKGNLKPVIPHWEGEVGLNVDLLQLAHKAFARTSRIGLGSAVMNILCNGGPVAAAERISSFMALHGLDASEKRRLHVGFAAGRFDFNNAPTGVRPRNSFEKRFWPAVKGKVFEEAAQIFLRLLRGDTISSEKIPVCFLEAGNFRKSGDWEAAQEMAREEGLSDADGPLPSRIAVSKMWEFEPLKCIPAEWRRELLQLVIGSHDPSLQEAVNSLVPVQVFNLSITRPELIEDTHRRLAVAYHADGGAWERSFMPRTTFVFLNAEAGLSAAEQSARAQAESREALGAYWKALEGTLDPAKVERAANNALIGNPEEVAAQALERFHPEDRLMLWFDFFNHDCDRVIRDQAAWMEQVAPRIAKAVKS